MTEAIAIEKIYSPSLYGVYVILLTKNEAEPTTLSDSRLSIDGMGYRRMGEVNRLRSRFKRAGSIKSSQIKLVGRQVIREPS